MSGYVCYCDFDYSGFAREEARRARKSYRCDECGGPIEPGDTYHYHAGKDDEWGVFWQVRECAPCHDGPAAFVRKHCPCTGLTDLYRHLKEDVFFEMAGDLKPGVRFKVGRFIVEMDRRRRAGATAVTA